MRYLAIGHICQDLIPNGWMFGGAATYSARAAHALGCEVQVLTSAAPDLDLSPALGEIEALRIPSEHTTTFENTYTPAGRHQRIHAVAERLTPDRFSAPLTADIVHLAPIAQEVDLAWFDYLPNALIGVTPQGWMRQWDAQGCVTPIAWAQAAEVLPRADVVITSVEDVGHDYQILQAWAQLAQLLVVTHGATGCTVMTRHHTIDVPTVQVDVVDATGAGDIFAACFLVRFKQTGDPLAAARFANCLASRSVTRRGLDSMPTPSEIEQCLSFMP